MKRFKKIFLLIAITAFFISLASPLFVSAADPVKFCGQVDIPLLNTIFKKSIEKDKSDCTPIDSNSIGKMVGDIYKFVVGLAAIAAVIVMMAGGYTWLFAGGNASKVGEAKSLIGSAVLGLFLALGSYMILYLINPELTKLKSLDQMNTKITKIKIGVEKICSSGERAEALKKNKEFKCGSIYPPASEKSDIDKCMDVYCPGQSGNQGATDICLVTSNSEGKYFRGDCVSSIGIIDNTGGGNRAEVIYGGVNAKCGKVIVGQGKITVDAFCASVGDPKANTCYLISQEGEDITLSSDGTGLYGGKSISLKTGDLYDPQPECRKN